MRTLTQKYLGGLAVKEDCFKVDLAVLERYQSFSSELLRLALLGIAGYGFLIANVAFKSMSGEATFYTPFAQNKALLVVGAVLLGIAAASALGHRYFSTDCLTHFVRRIRMTQSLDVGPLPPEAPAVRGVIEDEELSLESDIEKCKWMLIAAVLSLVGGVVCVAAAFAATLFGASTPP